MARKPSNEATQADSPRKSKPKPDRFVGPWKTLWPLLLPIVAACIAYCGAMTGEFVFDDVPTVKENLSLERLGGYWKAAFGEKHSPISNRPVVCFTFALNFALSGKQAIGDPGTFVYHFFNLLVHLANIALLWGVVRRMLVAPNLGSLYDERRATRFATAIAAVWAVHPLGTEAVVYITQRTTLVMSFFLLAMWYGSLRAATDVRHSLRWRIVSIASCAMAMMSKEEAVAAPILLLLFDRAFNFSSFQQAWEERWEYYLSSAATWLLLIACVVAGPKNPTVGYHATPEVNAFEWLMTETPVVWRYVRLTFWPSPLCAAYDWPIVRKLSEVFLPGMMILMSVGGVVGLWFWKPHWAWFGALFFLLLAPTTSLLPIVSEVVAERRMYLPMLALLAPVLLGLEHLLHSTSQKSASSASGLRRLAATLVAVCVIVETYATASYASVFQTELKLWTDVATKNPLTNGSFLSSSILSGYAKVLLVQQKADTHKTAIDLLERSRKCVPFNMDGVINLAAAYVDVGRWGEADQLYRDIASSNPNNANFYANYALFLQRVFAHSTPENQKGEAGQRLLLAVDLIKKAIQLNPRNAGFYNTLGSINYYLGKVPDAEQAWNVALQIEPNNINTLRNRAIVHVQLRRFGEAIPVLEALAKHDPKDVASLANLARAYQLSGNTAAATTWAQKTLQVDPNNPEAALLLKEIGGGK